MSVEQQLNLVLQAPVPVIVIAMAVAGGVWKAASAHFKARLETKDERLKYHEAQANEYREKLKVHSPDEAAAWVATLQARVDELVAEVTQLKPAQLTTQQQQAVTEHLRQHAGADALIMHDSGSLDALYTARGFAEALTATGWRVHTGSYTGGPPGPGRGPFVQFAKPDAVPASALAAVNGMQAAGLNPTVLPQAMQPLLGHPEYVMQVTFSNPR